MNQKFFGQIFPVNFLVAVFLVLIFTVFIRNFFPNVSPKTLEVERLLLQ